MTADTLQLISLISFIAAGVFLIIALFLKADVLIPTAVYLEVFFGAVQNLINVLGDVVTIAIEEKQVWKKE